MRKKRLIFTLLYNDGFFVQSRNFRLQKVGNVDWLLKNYNFKNIAKHIDELAIINISKDRKVPKSFFDVVDKISAICFMPKVLGGAINSIEDIEKNFKTGGADKVIINSLMFDKPEIVHEAVSRYGSQAIVGCFDFAKSRSGEIKFYKRNGSVETNLKVDNVMRFSSELNLGEIVLQSIDLDGTGFGLDLEVLSLVLRESVNVRTPIILSGGTGNYEHALQALTLDSLNAVSTANLLNFIGDSFRKTREQLIRHNINLPQFI